MFGFISSSKHEELILLSRLLNTRREKHYGNVKAAKKCAVIIFLLRLSVEVQMSLRSTHTDEKLHRFTTSKIMLGVLDELLFSFQREKKQAISHEERKSH